VARVPGWKLEECLEIYMYVRLHLYRGKLYLVLSESLQAGMDWGCIHVPTASSYFDLENLQAVWDCNIV
jgi:hypothetical protein